MNGTNLEALFIGRWDQKLLRDSSGRVFLDVNPTAFQAIVDWLNALVISSEDERRTVMPTVNAEYKHLLEHQMELFVKGDNKSKNLVDSFKPANHVRTTDEEDGSVLTELVDAIKEKWMTLQEVEADLLSLEEIFHNEEQFIGTLVGGTSETSDIVTLNVSGTIMATQRATLQVIKESVLAQQFDNTKWTEQSNRPNVKTWTISMGEEYRRRPR